MQIKDQCTVRNRESVSEGGDFLRLMRNNCGGDEGISTHQSPHNVEPVITNSLAIVLCAALMSLV